MGKKRTQKSRIIIEDSEAEGLKFKLDKCYSKEHAYFMLAQAIVALTMDSNSSEPKPEVEEEVTKEE